MKKTISVYNEMGEQRTVWEVLKEVKELFEKPVESYTVEISEEEINAAGVTKADLTKVEKNFLWCMEAEGKDIKIHPMNSDCITIHGKEEMWFFISRLLDYDQML